MIPRFAAVAMLVLLASNSFGGQPANTSPSPAAVSAQSSVAQSETMAADQMPGDAANVAATD